MKTLFTFQKREASSNAAIHACTGMYVAHLHVVDFLGLCSYVPMKTSKRSTSTYLVLLGVLGLVSLLANVNNSIFINFYMFRLFKSYSEVTESS